MKEEIKKIYKEQEKIMETSDVFTLKLLIDDQVSNYFPGQFITVYFPELGTPEWKAYSISSSPSENTINITVKSMGSFSRKLCSLEIGDNIMASLPYGYFYSESENTHLVMIAGGIGVAPFRSMIVNSIKLNQKRKLTLFYSNRSVDDIIFRKEFNEISLIHENFKVIYFITRQKIFDPCFVLGRMSVIDIIGNEKM